MARPVAVAREPGSQLWVGVLRGGVGFRGRSDRIAALRPISAWSGAENIDVLSGHVAEPADHIEDDAPRASRLLDELNHPSGSPAESAWCRGSTHHRRDNYRTCAALASVTRLSVRRRWGRSAAN